MSQKKPSEPVMRNVACQPKLICNATMMGVAMTLPSAAPLLKIDMAKARSFTGNHSAQTLAAPGQLPASPRPSRKRKTLKPAAPRAVAWAMAAIDHSVME